MCETASPTSGAGGSDGSGGTFFTELVIEEGQPGQCAMDGVVEATNSGFSGDGYINSDNLVGASVEWAFNVGEAGTYSLTFAYANASPEGRPADVLVGGTVVQAAAPFAPTPSWSDWSPSTVNVTLAAGENRVVLRATSALGLANIDSLEVSGASLSASDCSGTAGSGGGSGTGGATGGSGGGAAVPACATNERAACSDANGQIACHFGGEPGDYRVIVELGGDAAGDMYVDTEMYRRMLARTTTDAGESLRFSFVSNVRVYEGQPLDPDQRGSSKGTPGLDVYVRGTHPELVSICRERVTPAPKVWLAGDSTVCDQAGTDYSGWGQHLPQFFQAPLSIANYADSGESSGSFLASAKLWKTITSAWKSGDWVLIQLGHNDKDVTAANFEGNLKQMVTQARAAGVHPVLVTPISRAGSALASQHVSSTGANLPQIIRNLGTEEGVPVLDLTVSTWQWLQTVDWKSYFALGTDRTHPNPRGAEVIAGLVVDAIAEQQLELADHLR
ncbi:MAG TPA: GDSL-type esterase/lipase family protein [Polyangiaceae bacterium]|nr:GDSL-type esterase/lipase family protein [Polyangiaceae bacterium]